MLYRIYKLRFSTPVRFGQDIGGESQITFCADTLFSAIYLSLEDEIKQKQFFDLVNGDRLRFSDGLPYMEDHFYLPRPAGVYAKRLSADTDPSIRKLLKKIYYIPSDIFTKWLEGAVSPDKLIVRFGRTVERTRVNMRGIEPLPYQVDGFQFYDNCGLYVIATASDTETMALMDDAMRNLAATGIGGKLSSGWGHFNVKQQSLTASFIEQALKEDGAPIQMLLSSAFPSREEADTVMQDASYILKRRGGFTAGSGEKPVKKQTAWLFGAGSTFGCRFNGTIMNAATVSTHPVWRCAKALMMGVRTE